MNYKKMLVMLCLGSHLLATNSIAIAGWNPFKKMKKAIDQVTKPIESAADQAAAAARDAANRAAQEAARLAAEEAAQASRLANNLAAQAERSALVNTRFVANELKNPSQILEAMTPAISFLQGTTLSMTSEMSQVDQQLSSIYPKVLNLTDAELIEKLLHVYRVLERNNSLDLLRVWEPGWIERVEDRVSPLMAETGLPLLRAIRVQEQAIASAFTSSDSWLWQLAKKASAMTEDISNHLIKPMAASYDAMASTWPEQPEDIEMAELDDQPSARPVYWAVDDQENANPAMRKLALRGEDDFQGATDPNLIPVSAQLAPPQLEAEDDEDNTFDEDCGYLPIPLSIGPLVSFFPMDRKVPNSCGGWKAQRSHQEFILASQVRDYLNANEDEFLNNLVGTTTFFKQPYGVAYDVRWLNAVEFKPYDVTVATVAVMPHIRFPLAWSTPNPSARTLSQAGGNNLIRNFQQDRFFFSPEFEVAVHAGSIKDPLLSAMVLNVEFPIVVKDLRNTPHAVLQQIIVKLSYDRGIRWGAVNPQNSKDILNALSLFLRISRRLPVAEPVAQGSVVVTETFGEAAAATEVVPVIGPQLDKTMLAFSSILLLSLGTADFLTVFLSNDQEANNAMLTATMPFVMGSVGALARFGGISKFAVGNTAISVTDISLVKLQTVFGFLNANYAAALLNREPTAGDVGFDLVRPGTPDYVTFGLALLPQVTQTLFLLDFGTFKTGLQLWGPYGIYTPQMAWPRTVAGQVFLKNGTNQFEPLLLK